MRVPADASKVTVEGLTSGEYTCSVAADTLAGTGRATMQVVTIKSEPAPEAIMEPEPTVPIQTAPVVVPAPVPAPVAAPTPATPPPVRSSYYYYLIFF